MSISVVVNAVLDSQLVIVIMKIMNMRK